MVLLKKKKRKAVDAQEIHKMVTWLIKNTYFTFGNHIYQQTIGILMGTDAAPLIANLFLFYYKFNNIKTNMKTNYNTCKKLFKTLRYLDDITCINDSGTFDQVYKDIYPSSLELEKVNTTDQAANVLDISIIINNKNSLQIYLTNEGPLTSRSPTSFIYSLFLKTFYILPCMESPI